VDTRAYIFMYLCMNRRGEEKITKMEGALVAWSSGFVFACVAMGREIESVQGITMVVVFFGGGSATPCASPPPRPSIFSDYSFRVHHHYGGSF
jgi:hypothetical protein